MTDSILRRVLPSVPFAVLGAAFWLAPAILPRPDAHATPPAPAARPVASAPPSSATPASAANAQAPDLSGLSDAVSRAAERISPSVANLRVEAIGRASGTPFGFGPSDEGIVRGGGTGVVVRADGYVLTNNHVVENATRIEAQFRDGRRFVGRVVGTDPAIDLAVVKVEASDLVPAHFASSDGARVGQWVVAVGSPFGLDYTVTAGVVSAKGRGGLGANEIEDYLQTDASINPGNSGGPLVDLRGEVLGINTMIIGRASGIGFAIPSDLARHVADQIIANGHVRRAWLGVSFQEMTPELASYFAPERRRGALINEVAANGPAARAGVRSGDVVVSLDGQAVDDGHDLLRRLLRHDVGDHVRVEVLRERRPVALELVTGERPEPPRPMTRVSSHTRVDPQDERTGLVLAPLDDYFRQRLGFRGTHGVVVREVVQGSIGERAGVTAGDVVVSVDREAASAPEDVKRALADGTALLEIERGEHRFFTVLARTR